MNAFVWLTMMYHMQWQLADEDDEEYQPRVEIRRLVSNIPKFPDIAAFGPKAVGALKLLQDWINDDVGGFLEAHEKQDFLDKGLEYGKPLEVVSICREDAVKTEEGTDGAEEGADGAGAGEDERKRLISEEDKRKRRIYERKLQNFRASQATFYAEIKKAVSHNADVLRVVKDVPKCEDRGSKAIEAIKMHIMQGQNPGSVKEDSTKFFTNAAASFALKYPIGQTDPIACKPKDVNDVLSRALRELEMHVNDFKSNFEGFPEKHWSLYVPEQQVIQIIRDMLPETAEWRFVKMKIMQGEPDGDDFVRAIGDKFIT